MRWHPSRQLVCKHDHRQFANPFFGAIGVALENRVGSREDYGRRSRRPTQIAGRPSCGIRRDGRRPNYRYVERKVLAGWRSWETAREGYSGVKAPVTLIYGDRDWSRTPERERTKAALRDARLFTLQNTGHFSAFENPKEFAIIILS